MHLLPVYAIIVALSCLLLPSATSAQPTERSITITATEAISAIPDMAQISLGVEAAENSSAAALRAIRDNMNTIFAVLEELETEQRDMQTNGLSLQPLYERRNDQRQPRIIGYSARNGLNIRVRDLERLGSILDALAGAGANTINGVSFGLSDTAALMDEARRNAIRAAHERAQLYAQALDLRLGPVLSIQEGGTRTARPRAMALAEPAMEISSMPVAQGELSLSATVTLVYQLAD